MSSLTLENGRLATRSTFISSPTYSNVSDVVDFTPDQNGVIFCTHASNRISYGNGISQTYLETATGFATFPFLTNNIGFLFAGQIVTGNVLTKWFAAPASGGILFIAIQYANGIPVSTSTTLDSSLSGASLCYQGIRGVQTIAQITDPNTGNVTGSGFWEDLVWLRTDGTFAFLNQSTKANSATPYFVNEETQAITNNWLIPAITTSATKFDSPAIGTFVFPMNSSAAGSTIGFPQWPSLRPVVAGTRNFTQFTYKANPFAFESDGMTPRANWDSFAATSIACYGSLTMVSGPNYVYTMSIA